MAANRNRCLTKEISDVQKDTHSGVFLESTSKSKDGTSTFEDLTHFRGVFIGPPDTPYEGGKFYVDIKIPSEYPFQPPIMRFETRIWHPNVSSQTGAICLDTLGSAWSPILTLKSALISLQSLLSSPEPKDPQDAEVARMLITNPKQFNKVAREWAVRHAGAPETNSGGPDHPIDEEELERQEEQRKERAEAEKTAEYVHPSIYRSACTDQNNRYHGYNKALIDRFTEMGFDVPTVVAAFEHCGVETYDGYDFELEEEWMGDITARLFHEA